MKENTVTASQCSKILACLRRRIGHWVSMPRLVAASGSFVVHSRISDLRHAGFNIANRVKPGRPCKSFYRLEAGQ